MSLNFAKNDQELERSNVEEKQEQAKKPRRKILSSELEQMRQMEAEGKRRSEIARQLSCDRSVITRRLGAKRRYRDRRVGSEDQ